MKLLDWFASRAEAGNDGRKRDALSRRDFFARVSGRGPRRSAVERPEVGTGTIRSPLPFAPSPDALHTFYVPDFPGDHGRKLLPLLRIGQTLHLRRDRNHPDDPNAVNIAWGRSPVGSVPRQISAEIAPLIDAGTPPRCVVSAFDPAAEAPHVLQVELSPFVPY